MMIILKLECVSPLGFINVNYTKGIICKRHSLSHFLFLSLFKFLWRTELSYTHLGERHLEGVLNTEDVEQQL